MQFHRKFFLLALSLLPGFGLLAADGSALELARSAVASFQKESDKALTTITFPADTADLALPDSAEIHLIQGYINYDCIRLIWKDHQATAQRVHMTRSWFYSPKESYTAEEFPIAEADFKNAWQAILLINASSMKVNTPPEATVKTGWGRGTGTVSLSSHEWTYYVKVWTDAKEPLLTYLVRGTSTANGIQSFSEIQTRAICKIITNLIPKPDSGAPFDWKTWGSFLTGFLTENEMLLKYAPLRMDQKSMLLVETSLRLLGQMGYAPALPVIHALEADAKQAGAKANWPPMVLRESTLALLKIELQQQFDEDRATQLIHDFDRQNNPNRDFILWLRSEYFQRATDRYFALLSADVQNPQTRESVLLETVADLQARYPEKVVPLFESLLNNPSPEVVANAALGILAKDPASESSLQALNRLASDPSASIPPTAHWSAHFGRERALDYLTSEKSPVPPGYRWDVARVQKQLDLPWEDGRMTRHLLDAKWILQKRLAPDETKVTAYRKTLAGPFNLGTADACEALIELKDKDSGPRITAILQDLAAHCNKGLAWEADPGAQYPWIDKYEIERISDALNKMLTSPSVQTPTSGQSPGEANP